MQYPRFITPEILEIIQERYKTPLYLYSEKELRERVKEFMSFPSAFGHTIRYAMKANPQINILKIFDDEGLHFDASSDYEALRVIDAGIDPKKIQLSSQELGDYMQELVEKGVFFVATSLYQLKTFGELFPGRSCGIRVNPGSGSGGFKKIATGGKNSSFGIWYEQIDEVIEAVKKYDIQIIKLHFHIGSENSPESWVESANAGFEIIKKIPEITTFDMGGGQKMAIMDYEVSADLQAIGEAVKAKFEEFYRKTGRKIHLEMEPGKYLVINSCSMITQVQDIVSTGNDGYTFLKVNSGMNDMPRVAMYGVQEPLFIMNDSHEEEEYVVVGHCCESSDILTSKLYDAETIEPRKLKKAEIGDVLIVDGVGAYNSAMAMKNYNSFPESGELMLHEDRSIVEIRKRQEVNDIWKNEINVI